MKKWKTSTPAQAGWYEVPRQEGKAYWTGKRWASKGKGETLVPSVGQWRDIESKLTPWFPYEETPINKGEYECEYTGGYNFRAYWDGGSFLIRDIYYPDHWNERVSQPCQWRGILK